MIENNFLVEVLDYNDLLKKYQAVQRENES
jgi:hypothetical protein